MRELVTEADEMNLPEIQAFIDDQLEEVGCPIPTRTAIDVAVEKLFIHITGHVFDQDNSVTVQVTTHEDPPSVEITFIDSGRHDDPHTKDGSDITLPVKDRIRGGLSVFRVKSGMDDARYEYKDGKNFLTIKKNPD